MTNWEEEHTCEFCGKKVKRKNMEFTRDCYGIVFRLVCLDCYDLLMSNGYDGEKYTELDENINDDY